MAWFKRHYLAAALLFFVFEGYTQEKPAAQKDGLSVKVSFHPLPLAYRIIKFETEVRRVGQRFAYLISPEIFNGTVYDKPLLSGANRREDKLSGFGLGLQQRFIVKPDSDESPYISYGATYRYNVISFEDEGFRPYPKNGLTYYEYRSFQDDLKINAYLVHVLTGYQAVSHGLLLDGFMGFSYKWRTRSGEMNYKRNYEYPFSGYAYTGFLWTLGVKIGFQLR